MKAKEITALLMLVILMLGSIWVSSKAAKLANDITEQITETISFIEDKEFSPAILHCNTATKLWNDNSAFCKVFLHHNDSDTIDMIISEFEYAVKSGNIYEASAKGKILCNRLTELKELETLSVLSLL